MVLQFRLKKPWKISQWLDSFAWKVIVRTTRVKDETYKVWGTFFHKKASHGATNVFGKTYRGMFYPEAIDHAIGNLIVKRFQKSSQVSFPLIDHDLGY